jgi:NADH:ubiquinone oxidoreductase subunit F (NADH-binding)
MTGTCFCPLGESVPPSLVASLKHFRHEYERHIARAAGAQTEVHSVHGH